MKKDGNALSGAELRRMLNSIAGVRLRDRERLRRTLERIAAKLKRSPEADVSTELDEFKRQLEKAANRELVGADSLSVSYPDELPVSHRREEIGAAISKHSVVIVCGSTGSGKTTQLPKILLERGCGRMGMIGCTQPRRLAATAMAARLAAELDVEVGEEVGCKVRFDDRTGDRTVVKFMTDGILLAEAASDRDLLDYDAIIIDEVHERSLNIDFILGYLKRLLQRRHDLKVVISSATLDAERLSEFFGGAPIIRVEGRTYPVDDLFMPPEEDEELAAHVSRAVDFLSGLDPHGDILVFLPGEREIRAAADVLKAREYRSPTEILPLYARLSRDDQQKIFRPGRARRIILATNVAETSVTIPRIHYVVDSGLARISRYDPRTGIQELRVEQISRASARQRRGRCGRLTDGVCIYLYSEDVYNAADEYTTPEIRRTSLAGVMLQMEVLHLGDISGFPFVDPPPPNLVRDGRRTLADTGAVDASGRITPLGRRMASLPVDPHFARMMIEGEKLGFLPELVVLAAYFSIPDPHERPAEKQQQAEQAHAQWRDKSSDFMSALRLWNFIGENSDSRSSLRRLARRNFLNGNRLIEWKNLSSDIWDAVHARSRKAGEPPKVMDTDLPGQIHQAILTGIPRHIAMYDREKGDYLGVGGRRFVLFPGSGLSKLKPPPPWIAALAIVETSRVFARTNAAITPDMFEKAAPHLCSAVYDQPRFDAASGFVYARERLVFGGLPIHAGRRVHYGAKCPEEARKIFIREALANGLAKSDDPQIRAHLKSLERLRGMEMRMRRPESLLDTDGIFDYLDGVLPPEVVSVKSLESYLRTRRLFPLPEEKLRLYDVQAFDFEDYPDSVECGGVSFPLLYTFDPEDPADGVAIVARRSQLRHLAAARLDYLVPGYLREKVGFILRALPKDKRRAASPLADTVEGFVEAFKSGAAPSELPLSETLADYLEKLTGAQFSPRELEAEQLPNRLIMKIALSDGHGRITGCLTDLPGGESRGSAVGGGADPVTGGARWLGGVLPEKLEVAGHDGVEGYPALCVDNGAVSSCVYLRGDEAEVRHANAVVELFFLHHDEQIRFVTKPVRFSNTARCGIFLADAERLYRDDFKRLAVRRAMDCDLWSIRSPEAYRAAEERAVSSLGEAAENLVAELEKLAELYEKTSDAVDKFAPRSRAASSDVRRQLSVLFRAGFLRHVEAFGQLRRYLRGINLRLERMNSSPAKDEAKLEPLQPVLERFHASLAAVDEITWHPQLAEFLVMIQELRLAIFAPEVGGRSKASVKSAMEFWNKLRI